VKIARSRPPILTVSIEWSEIERGHWRAVCMCKQQDHAERVDKRVRLHPLDPETSRHADECEFAGVPSGSGDIPERSALRSAVPRRADS
jgi:hypothetical protein